ncbi:MAG: glycerophosphodiester phosphodiesterase family protein [Solirubrobacterales bacterium]
MRRGIGRRLLTAAATIGSIAGLSAVVLAPSAGAVAPNPNPWLQNRFLVMAHQGGEDEAPSNTMFALKSAIQDRGADSLELDVNMSSDGQLMVIHDDTWKRIACTDALCPGPDSSTEQHRPATEVNDLTAAELQQLDAGYWFRPGSYSHDYTLPDSAYPYRGIRTGAVPPPTGYSPEDFVIPTLKQVLDTFPGIPINVEIKMIKTTTGTAGGCVMDNGTQYCDDPDSSMPVADALAGLLNNEPQSVRDNVIVVSFSDQLLAEFHQMDHTPNVALAGATDGTTNFALFGTTPNPDVAAFQVPPEQSGFDVPQLLLQNQHAHELGYAVHVWTNGDQDETDASYAHLYGLGVDGIMSSDPSRLSAWLCANHVPRPDGSSRGPGCAAPVPSGGSPPPAPQRKVKRCKKGKHRKKGHCIPKRCKKHKRRKGRRCVPPKHWAQKHGKHAGR